MPVADYRALSQHQQVLCKIHSNQNALLNVWNKATHLQWLVENHQHARGKSIFCHCPVIWRMMIEVHNYDGGGDGADLEGIGDGIHLLHLGRVFCSDFWHTAARDGDCQIYQ